MGLSSGYLFEASRLAKFLGFVLCLGLAIATSSCDDEGSYREIGVGSLSFLDGETVPIRHTCDGGGISPSLIFEDFPWETSSFAVVMTVPNGGASPFSHWVMWGISSSSNFLHEDQNREIRIGAVLGANSTGTLGYFGPCPIRGETALFTIEVYALDRDIVLAEGSGRTQLEAAMDGHIVGKGKLTGRYSR